MCRGSEPDFGGTSFPAKACEKCIQDFIDGLPDAVFNDQFCMQACRQVICSPVMTSNDNARAIVCGALGKGKRSDALVKASFETLLRKRLGGRDPEEG